MFIKYCIDYNLKSHSFLHNPYGSCLELSSIKDRDVQILLEYINYFVPKFHTGMTNDNNSYIEFKAEQNNNLGLLLLSSIFKPTDCDYKYEINRSYSQPTIKSNVFINKKTLTFLETSNSNKYIRELILPNFTDGSIIMKSEDINLENIVVGGGNNLDVYINLGKKIPNIIMEKSSSNKKNIVTLNFPYIDKSKDNKEDYNFEFKNINQLNIINNNEIGKNILFEADNINIEFEEKYHRYYLYHNQKITMIAMNTIDFSASYRANKDNDKTGIIAYEDEDEYENREDNGKLILKAQNVKIPVSRIKIPIEELQTENLTLNYAQSGYKIEIKKLIAVGDKIKIEATPKIMISVYIEEVISTKNYLLLDLTSVKVYYKGKLIKNKYIKL